jgi:CBS domain-containing protein
MKPDARDFQPSTTSTRGVAASRGSDVDSGNGNGGRGVGQEVPCADLPAAAHHVADVMTGPAPIVPSHLTMAAARKIAALKSVPWLLVEAAGKLIGILDQRALATSRDEDFVSTHTTMLTMAVTPATSVASAHALLMQNRVAWLPVVAGMFVVGAVSREALSAAMARASDRETRVAHLAA